MLRRLHSPDFNGTPGCPPSPYDPLIRDAAAVIFGCPPPVPSDRDNSSSSTPIELRRTSRHLYPLIIVSAALITAALLLSLFCLLRHLRRRRRLRELQQHHGPLVPPPPLPDGDDGPLPDADQQHHVWLIRTVGLDDATIKAIAAWPYKAADGLIDGRDCAVCLGEFNDGELLKLLPKCSHAFHAPCIDTWLKSHVNCPLCRAPVLAPKGTSFPLPANVGSSNNSSTPQDTAVDDYTVHLIPQIPAHSEDLQDLELDHAISDENREHLPAQGGCTSSIVAVPSDAAESVLQPVRRSVSLDSFSLGVIVLRGEMAESDRVGKCVGEEVKEERSVGESIVKNKGKQGNACKGPSLQKRVRGMERSLSSSGRRFCLSRNRRVNRNSSILPL